MLDETTVRAALDEFRRRHRVPGVALCAFTSEGPRYAIGSGTASTESGAPVTPDTMFRIYSLTKLLTGSAVVTLAAEGLVKLDAPINQYLPELRVRGSADDGGITLRHLLSHHAGWLPDSVRHDGLERDAGGLERNVLNEVARMPRLAAPGELYSYSNLGVSLAGLIGQRIGGEPFGEFMRDRLYRPLEMANTTHDPAVAMTYPLAQHHILTEHGDLGVAHDARHAVKHEPASQCYSTVVDIGRFGAAHLGGAGWLLSRNWLGQMHQPHVNPHLDVDIRYGLTCYLGPAVDGMRLVGHEGFLDGMWIKLVLDVGKDVGVVWMDNRGEELREQRYELLGELFDGLGRTPTGTAPHGPITATEVTGDYYRVGAESVAVRADGDALAVTSGSKHARLVPGPSGTWVSPDEHGPSTAPWGPHAGSRRICLGVTDESLVHLNGLPYLRQCARS
ncbi:MAG TPA: serine hydrolase domain-containing protein [Pseudonocardiaceae bacterium]|nr:serine hydrolase domain-containing protein [Pseudonocardiaceae bacterium]